MISGSTDGIGLAMAKELATRGHSIIVIGRNEEKLANTKSQLEAIETVGEVMTVKIDLSDTSPENFERIRRQIDPENRDIGILINNAGTFPSIFTRFCNGDPSYLRDIMNVNMLAVVLLTHMILPGMLKRGRGLVVNVSSMLGAIPAPYMSVYGPTKSFVDAFSRILQIEYSSHPVDIINLTPGAVSTKLFEATARLEKLTPFNPSPEDYARTSINALATGISSYCGTMAHGFSNEASKVIDALGLMTFMFKINLKFNAKNVQISPVMKRTQPQAGDEEETALSAENTSQSARFGAATSQAKMSK